MLNSPENNKLTKLISDSEISHPVCLSKSCLCPVALQASLQAPPIPNNQHVLDSKCSA